MKCNHNSKSLSILSAECLDSIRCPLGHKTLAHSKNLCYCYDRECSDYSFCGFCQHKNKCRNCRQNRPTGFWLFALSFNKRLPGKRLADYATPLWENLNEEQKSMWRDLAKKTRRNHSNKLVIEIITNKSK